MCWLVDRRGHLQGWDSEDGWRGPNSPFPLFLCLQRHVVPPIPVLGIPTSLTPGCRSSPSLGKGEQRSGGEGSQSLAIY